MEARTTAGRGLLLAAPWVAILVITGALQAVRGEVLDATIFGIVAAVVVADALGVSAPSLLPRIRIGVLVVGAVVAGVALVLAPRHGVLAGIALVAVGVLALPAAWLSDSPRRRDGRPPRLVRAAIAWAAVTVALCLWELSSFLLGRADAASKNAHPAVSDLLDPLLDTPLGRTLFVAAWLAVGVLLLSRRRPT